MLQRLTLGLVLCIMASGCASISKEECANANWEAIGYRDGSHGKSASRFDSYQKTCAKHGFSADFTLYKNGHHRGLEEVFCKPSNGYQLGLRGAGYNNVCPSDLEKAFLSAYYYGRGIYKTQKSYNLLNQQVVNLNNRLAMLDERIAELKKATKKDALADYPKSAQELRDERTQTAALYDRIKGMKRKARRSKAFEDHLRHELAQQNKCSERCVLNNVRQSDLSDIERRAIHSIARLSIEKGHIESQVNWLNNSPKDARTNRHRRAALQRQLNELSIEINNLKRKLHRHPFSIHEKKHLAHCFELAEYAGVVQHHLEAQSYQRAPHVLNSLIEVHFDAEMKSLNQRIEFARSHIPSKEARVARHKRKRELEAARRQRKDYLREIENLGQKLVQMQKEIERLKSESRY